MPIETAALLAGLKPVLKALDADLLDRAKDPGVEAGLKAAWQSEKEAGRTGDAFTLWKRRRTGQVAIAWVLSVIFVRTLEDRGFLNRRRIAGPGAADSEQQLVAMAPFLGARDYLLFVFRELARLPGAGDLFDARHNPVWVLAPSAGGARRLLDLFRQTDAEGELVYRFDGDDTRFLGDLYQNLSEDVRKRFALLQTPTFVEEFILEQTLDPAIRTFGLAKVKLIDPTCGSGHFLLGAFHRLYDAWQAEAPGLDRKELARRALEQVHGCDLNPYAVAIARFRLTLELLAVAGITRLDQAPRLPLNLCVADSLLHGVTHQQMRLSEMVDPEGRALWGDQLFALEDDAEALRILGQRYEAVVGNPPYITEKDAKKRELYRQLHESAAGQFALAAPFTERFFDLATTGGFVGMINANSFTKRDFGKTLIEDVLPRYDVQKIVDTSGAYIPGHGTPTLLLFGRKRTSGDDGVFAVLGKRGEAEEPADPAAAPVWSEIVTHHRDVGFDGQFVSVELVPRQELGEHPWILAGGGARVLVSRLSSNATTMLNHLTDGQIGRAVRIGADSVFMRGREALSRAGFVDGHSLPMATGELIRDWALHEGEWAWYPYDLLTREPANETATEWLRDLKAIWPFRALLSARSTFQGRMADAGLAWFEYMQHTPSAYSGPFSITFAFVATHNHFVLERGGRVFNRHAPIIKLKDQYDEDDHLALLGLLNSSVVGLWCRLVMFLKGGDQVGDGARVSPAPWDRHLEYAGNLLKALPIADLDRARPQLLRLVREAETTVQQMHSLAPPEALARAVEFENLTKSALRTHQQQTIAELEGLRGVLVSIQEEIDWRVYGLYGLPTLAADDLDRVFQPVAPEHRPFEVRLARDLESDLSAKIWFERHKRTPPTDVGGPLAELYGKRLALIEQHKELQLLETPETKRRWSPRDYEAEYQDAYRDFLLTRIEDFLSAQAPPAALSARQLAAELHRDPKALAVAEVFTNETAPDLERLVSSLVQDEGVPYLAALTFTDTGMEKHQVWRETWDLQRREDAGEKVGDIPVPPKYDPKDFRRGSFWTHRGKLDVPKERFVLYPGAETDNDPTPWLGWAGWDHLGKATALAALYQQRKNEEGFDQDRLVPLIAGLGELVPWLIQWFNQPDPAYGGQRLGDFFRDFVANQAHEMGLTSADLAAWRPPAAQRGKRAAASTRRPKLEPAALLFAVPAAGDISQADLAAALGVAGATVGKVAKGLVENGELVETSGRPKRYARPPEMRTAP